VIVKTRHRALAPQGGGAQAAQRAHVAREVRLVGVAEIEGDARPALLGRGGQRGDERLQPHDAPEEGRPDPDVLEKEALELAFAEAEVSGELGDLRAGRAVAKGLDGGAHLRVRGPGAAEAGVELAFDEAQPFGRRRGFGQGVGEPRAGAAPERVEGRREVAQRGESHREKGRGAAGAEAHPEQVDAAGQGDRHGARHGADEAGRGRAGDRAGGAEVEEQVGAAVGQHAVGRGRAGGLQRPVAGDVAAQRCAGGVLAVVHGGAPRA
jgi:hypothetical protein